MRLAENSSVTDHAKPRLLFFRSYVPNLPVFIQKHLQEHVKCLSLSFEVILISEQDCDYRAGCELHQPDLTLFESGIYSNRTRRIRNASAFPEIPKLGLINADAYCSSRKLFLAEMESWGVETFFSISVSMAEYTPEIADNLFVWPNFADADVYKDYGEHKVVPVLFTGSLQTHYPWRNKIHRRVSTRYPSMTCPHLGWFNDRETAHMLSGERYARLLNASLAVPACGTIANEVVRKHFEIPGAKACLLAPPSLALEAAGFVHMVNCVFTDESGVLDHLEYLFKNPDELERITLAGHQLVHSFHTMQHRDQLYQWFKLHRTLQPNQRIVQPGPFKPLTTTENPQIHNSHIVVNGTDRVLLKTGYQQMWAGNYTDARRTFLRCLNYHSIPEPKLAMVILSLLTGDIVAARSWYANLLDPTGGGTGDGTPDPVERAFNILMRLCEGDGEEAIAAAGKFPALRHPALDRTRRIVTAATANQPDATADPHFSYSIHRLPELDPTEWMSMVCSMLRACGQPGMAERVSRVGRALPTPSGENMERVRPESNQAVVARRQPYTSRRLAISTKRWVRKYLWCRIKKALQGIEGKIGYFLPYKSSTASHDEWFSLIEKLSGQEPLSKVVFIGARRGSYLTESFLLGVRKNPTLPSVVLVNEDERVINELLKCYSDDPQIIQISKSTELLPEDAGILLIVDGSELKSPQIYQQYLACATIVVLDDINNERTQALHLSLASNSDYTLIAHNPEHFNGYAIVRRNWSNSHMYTCSSDT